MVKLNDKKLEMIHITRRKRNDTSDVCTETIKRQKEIVHAKNI